MNFPIENQLLLCHFISNMDEISYSKELIAFVYIHKSGVDLRSVVSSVWVKKWSMQRVILLMQVGHAVFLGFLKDTD